MKKPVKLLIYIHLDAEKCIDYNDLSDQAHVPYEDWAVFMG
jgi:hypothetical protein